MSAKAWSRGLVPPLLRDRVFRRYWGASTVSMFGDQISSVALPLTAVLVLHAGAASMGYLTALQWLPSLLFALHAGAWVDRRGKRRLAMILADLGRAAALATIPLCYALHVLTLAQMYVVTFIAGALSVLFTVSDGTLFVSIVPPDSYVDGQSLIYGSRAFSFMGGPSVGGLLVEALTAPFAIVADALSFVGSALQLAVIKPAEPPSSDVADGVTAGLRFVGASPIVRASLTGVAVINFFNMMFSALFMLYAVRMLHVRPGVLGVVIGAGAVGGMIASLTAKRLGNRLGIGLVYVVGCFVFTLPLALVPLAASVHGVAVLLMLFAAEFASGFGVMVLDISIGAIFAMVIPDTMRSRVSGAFQAINYGTRPAGALIGGALGASAGLRPALWVAVAGGVAGALLLLPSPLPGFRMPTGYAPGSLEDLEDIEFNQTRHGDRDDRSNDAGRQRVPHSGGQHHEDGLPPRLLMGILPERAPFDARISLLVQITLTPAKTTSATLEALPWSTAETDVTVTVSAPDLIPLGSMEQKLTVPPNADSRPVRFGFISRPAGLHSVNVRASIGETCLAELVLRVSVEPGATFEEGRAQSMLMVELTP